MTTQAMITTTVPWISWFWLGHSTLRSSPIDSRTKFARPACRSERWPAGLGAGSGAPARAPPDRLPPLALLLACHRPLASLAPRAPLRSRLAGHYRVSRCTVCRPHQRQYFLSSTRSGVFRFDFIDS